MEKEVWNESNVLVCDVCGQVQRRPRLQPTERALCLRCGATLEAEKVLSRQRTLAFSVAALLLYIPANVFPIMSFEYYGAVEHNTVWSGAVQLAKSGMWIVAGVVFVASIVVPLIKLAALFFLAFSSGSTAARRWKTSLYRVLRVIGAWAMLDVFLLSILVALVKLGQLATVTPGPGALPFTLVVVFTLLAAESFDPRLIWRHDRNTGSAR